MNYEIDFEKTTGKWMVGYEPLLDSWILGVAEACTTRVHRPKDDCASQWLFPLKNHSRRNGRSPKEWSKKLFY